MHTRYVGLVISYQIIQGTHSGPPYGRSRGVLGSFGVEYWVETWMFLIRGYMDEIHSGHSDDDGCDGRGTQDHRDAYSSGKP
jgi:hypothetical protein